MDEVEHDTENYQGRGLCCLPKPKAEADNTHRGLVNSQYHAITSFNKINVLLHIGIIISILLVVNALNLLSADMTSLLHDKS